MASQRGDPQGNMLAQKADGFDGILAIWNLEIRNAVISIDNRETVQFTQRDRRLRESLAKMRQLQRELGHVMGIVKSNAELRKKRLEQLLGRLLGMKSKGPSGISA